MSLKLPVKPLLHIGFSVTTSNTKSYLKGRNFRELKKWRNMGINFCECRLNVISIYVIMLKTTLGY